MSCDYFSKDEEDGSALQQSDILKRLRNPFPEDGLLVDGACHDIRGQPIARPSDRRSLVVRVNKPHNKVEIVSAQER